MKRKKPALVQLSNSQERQSSIAIPPDFAWREYSHEVVWSDHVSSGIVDEVCSINNVLLYMPSRLCPLAIMLQRPSRLFCPFHGTRSTPAIAVMCRSILHSFILALFKSFLPLLLLTPFVFLHFLLRTILNKLTLLIETSPGDAIST